MGWGLEMKRLELREIGVDDDSRIQQYFIKCTFNDECDTCGNEANEQSYMSGTMEEADYYICRSCALDYIDAQEHTDAVR